MDKPLDLGDPRQVASKLIAEISALTDRSTPNERIVIQVHSTA